MGFAGVTKLSVGVAVLAVDREGETEGVASGASPKLMARLAFGWVSASLLLAIGCQATRFASCENALLAGKTIVSVKPMFREGK